MSMFFVCLFVFIVLYVCLSLTSGISVPSIEKHFNYTVLQLRVYLQALFLFNHARGLNKDRFLAKYFLVV